MEAVVGMEGKRQLRHHVVFFRAGVGHVLYSLFIVAPLVNIKFLIATVN